MSTQVWRLLPNLTAWVCPGRPNRPVPTAGGSRADFLAQLAASSVYTVTPVFTLGATKPDAGNSGVTAGTVLTPWTSTGTDYVVSTAGAVIENLDIYGYLKVQANNVTVRNCRIRGKSASYLGSGIVDCAGVTGTLLDRCTIKPDVGLWWLNCVKAGAGTIVRRCDLSGGVDAVSYSLTSGAVTMEGCYIHDNGFFDNSSDHASDAVYPYWTHNDGVQLSGGSGHVIRGNTFSTYASTTIGMPNTLRNNGFADLTWGSGITVSPDKGPVTGALIELNWLEGGTTGFQMSALPAAGGSTNFGTIQSNRFGMGQHDYGAGSRYQIRYKSGYTIANLTTNYFDPNAPSVPPAKAGVFFTVGFSGGIRID